MVLAYEGNDRVLVCVDDQPHWDRDTAQTPTGGWSGQFAEMGESLTGQRRVGVAGTWAVDCFSQGGISDGTKRVSIGKIRASCRGRTEDASGVRNHWA